MAKKDRVYETMKKCYNHCPNCGASDKEGCLTFSSLEADVNPHQDGLCDKCGITFTEVYGYIGTQFVVDPSKRVRCEGPLAKFFVYMDEVPFGTKVSKDGKYLISEGEKNPADALLIAACEIVQDYDNYGEVLQTDSKGKYGKKSAIEELRTAIKKYKDSL